MNPYKKMALDIIIRALKDANGEVGYLKSDRIRKKATASSRRWIRLSPEFEFYCDAVGLDSDVLRAGVADLTEQGKGV